MQSDSPNDYLLYDGECPVCNRYVLWSGLRRHCPGIELLNAREWPNLVRDLRTQGIEVNNTMVLNLNGRRYIGAAAMTAICGLVEPASLRERTVRFFTQSPRTMRAAYPFLVRGRKLLLQLLGRSKIT